MVVAAKPLPMGAVIDREAVKLRNTPESLFPVGAYSRIEDVLALPEQPNLPGTMGDQHPNWRRRMPVSADTLLDQPAVAARLAGINNARKQ